MRLSLKHAPRVERKINLPADVASYRAYRWLVQRRRDGAPDARLDVASIVNALPNSGGVPITKEYASARDVISSVTDLAHRRQDAEGFEGFAADDAVFDESAEGWEYWSNARLAGTITTFAVENYPNPSVLELGCGAGHLFGLLRGYGIYDYFGIDGSPYFLDLNPRLRGHEAHFRTLNLQQEIRLEQQGQPLAFDVVCSFEVLEHIREEVVDELLATIRNQMHQGSVAFLTASTLGGMDVHVLVRDRPWWLERFAAQGLYPRVDEEQLRRRIGRRHPFNWQPHSTNTFALKVR